MRTRIDPPAAAILVVLMTGCAREPRALDANEGSMVPPDGGPVLPEEPGARLPSEPEAAPEPTAVATVAEEPPISLIEPSEAGSDLTRSDPGFEAVRKGKPLKIGSEGTAVLVVQTMLAAWNYDLEPKDLTGRYDEKTARAVFSYRVETGLNEPPQGGFDKEAKAKGVFDAKALQMFEGRAGARVYRVVRGVDAKRGVRVHVPPSATPEAVYAAAFPDPDARRRAGPANATPDKTDTSASSRGEVAMWIPLAAYVCGMASRVDPASCPR